MPKRALLVGLGALALLAVAAPFVGLEVEGLTRAVLYRSRAETGIVIEASRSRFRLLGGLTLEGVSARARSAVIGYDVRLDRIQFVHRPLSLLGGRFEVRRVVLEHPRIELVTAAGGGGTGGAPSPARRGGAPPEEAGNDPAREAAPPTAGGSSAIRIAPSTSLEVWIRGASFRAGDGVVVEGLDLTLSDVSYERRALTPLHALDCEGAASIARVALEKLRLESLEAGFRAQGGRFELEPLRFQTPYGSFAGKVALDFNVLPLRYRLELVGDGVDVASLGAGRLRLDAEGFGSESRNLTGEGTLELGPGALPDVPWVRAIDGLIAGADFRTASVRFGVRRNVVHVDELRFEGDSFALGATGSIDLDGAIDLDITLNRDDGRGLYSFKGTLEAPEVTRRD